MESLCAKIEANACDLIKKKIVIKLNLNWTNHIICVIRILLNYYDLKNHGKQNKRTRSFSGKYETSLASSFALLN